MKYLFITWILMVSSIILAQINDPIDDESKSFVKIMLTSNQYKQKVRISSNQNNRENRASILKDMEK